MWRALLLSLVASLVLLGSGCEEKVRPPPAPELDGSLGDGAIIPPPRRRDGGPGTADGSIADAGGADAAMEDGGRPPGCIPVDGPSDPNTAALTLDGTEYPFSIQSAFATWDQCLTRPVLLIGLTDGTCIPAVGQQLLFSFDQEAIGTTFGFLGPFDVHAETGAPEDIIVRFRAPRDPGPGADEWGTCMGASGTIAIEEIGVAVGTIVRATYDLTLTDCTTPVDQLPMRIMGTFSIPIEVPLDAVCG